MNPAAKRILVSYSHDSNEHRRLVRQLADSLKENGFEVSLDQYLPEDPPEGWPLWMEKQIRFAHKVLMVCTETYLRRVQKEEEPGKGRGVCWEANLIYAELYESQAKTNKFIPVVLREDDRRFVPMPLGANSVFQIEDAEGFEKLFRSLTGQTNHAAPPTGSIPSLPVPQPLPTFKLNAASALPMNPVVATRTSTVVAPLPVALARSLKPNTAPESRFELRQLDWYEEADADFFRGREADAKALRSLLLDQPVVRLFGASGVGKSSLLRAGLVPELRRHGFRSVVVRPFKNPEETIPKQISEQLLSADSPRLSSKLTLESLQAELGPAFVAEQCPYLFVLIDQVEDVVSPLVPLEARERLVNFLQQVWNSGSTSRPLIRVLVAYRTDADVRLGPLWQEVSGASSGLPYHAIQGLTRDVARRVLSDALAQSSQPTTAPLDDLIDDLIDDLVRESLSLDASGEVFPPYLQMIIAQPADTSASSNSMDKEASAVAALKITSAGDLIGIYMRSRLAYLESRGGDFTKCRAVLEALSCSTGQKLTLSLGEIAAEVHLSRDSVQPLLDALVSSRLVRPFGDSYEVQHDRLSESVITSLSDSDREFKAARELLATKTISHVRTEAWLTTGECHFLYCHHARLSPNRAEQRLLLGSLLAGDHGRLVAGWRFLSRMSESGISLYREFARDESGRLRQAAIPAIAAFRDPADLPMLRELAHDKDEDVRRAVAEALASFQNSEDLPLLRELINDDFRRVRLAAVAAAAAYQCSESMLLMREALCSEYLDVRKAAYTVIVSAPGPKGLRLRLALARSNVQEALWFEKLLEWVGKPLAGSLFSEWLSVDAHDDWKSRRRRWGTLKVIEAFEEPDGLPRLREFAGDDDAIIRSAAVRAIASFNSSKDLALLRKLAHDKSRDVRKAAVEAISKNEPRLEIEEWFLASVAELPIDVVARFDYLLYAPEWWKKLMANE